jgi:hypothetical protein
MPLHPLAREIGLVLALKLVALAVLYWLFFAPAHQVSVDADRAAAQLFAPAGHNEKEGSHP